MELKPVAYYRGPLGSKFGIPRQSGLAEAVAGRLVFEPAYRDANAVRGLEGFDRIWLLWGFSANRPAKGEWQPTVRPPRLGGNGRLGVWATRSPFRPNPLGLSAVRLLRVEAETPDGPVLHVAGADLMDGTPVYDIKPYIAYADSFPDAASGFAGDAPEPVLDVIFQTELPFGQEDTAALRQILSLDPRPAYQEDPDRTYGFPFGGCDIRFRVCGNILTVTEILPL